MQFVVTEKQAILKADQTKTLNKKFEITAQYRHKAKLHDIMYIVYINLNSSLCI